MKMKSNAGVWKFFILLVLAAFLTIAKKTYTDRQLEGVATSLTASTAK